MRPLATAALFLGVYGFSPGALAEDCGISDQSAPSVQALLGAAGVGHRLATYTPLELRILDAVQALPPNNCGQKLLGATLSDELAPPAPGFTLGREHAYTDALDILDSYGLLFQDEDDPNNALDVRAAALDGAFESNLSDPARWTADELKEFKAILQLMGPTFRNLPTQAMIREDRHFTLQGNMPIEHHFLAGAFFDDVFIPERSPEIPAFTEMRIRDEAFNQGPGCRERVLVHELFHLYFMKHRDQANEFMAALGWQPLNSDVEDATWIDCAGRAVPITNRNYVRPPNYLPPGVGPYYQRNFEEDIAERATFYVLGPYLESLGSACARDRLRGAPPRHPGVQPLLEKYFRSIRDRWQMK